MMKRLLAVALLAATPLTASAGFGTTATLGSIENSIGDSDTGIQYFSPQHRYPTLDYKAGEFLLQIAALDLINSIGFDDNVLFGVNAYYQIQKGQVSEDVMGVVQIGGSLDYDQAGEDINFTTLLLSGRMGAQSVKKMGFGIYVVPEIGVSLASEDARPDGGMELAVGGQVQISTWIGGK